MVPRGLEPRTLRLLAVRSDQLSYETCVNCRQPNIQLPVLHCHSLSLDIICISLSRLGQTHGPMQNTAQHPSTVVTPHLPRRRKTSMTRAGFFRLRACRNLVAGCLLDSLRRKHGGERASSSLEPARTWSWGASCQPRQVQGLQHSPSGMSAGQAHTHHKDVWSHAGLSRGPYGY